MNINQKAEAIIEHISCCKEDRSIQDTVFVSQNDYQMLKAYQATPGTIFLHRITTNVTREHLTVSGILLNPLFDVPDGHYLRGVGMEPEKFNGYE